MLRTALATTLALVATSAVYAEQPGPALHVPQDDLPWASAAGRRIDFAANGAMTLSSGGRTLCDIGLMYTDPEWNEWGTQRRRSAPGDDWEQDPEDPLVLVHHGTLHHFDGGARFGFIQRTRVTEWGLEVVCEIEPRPNFPLGLFGVALHAPAAGNAGAGVSLWPGFQAAAVPGQLGDAQLLNGPGRGAKLTVPDGPPVEVIIEDGSWWSVLDDRQWDLNTFRIIGADWRSRAALEAGETGTLRFEVVLAPRHMAVADLAGLQLWGDRFGGTVLTAADGPVAEFGFTWREDARKWLRHRGLPEECTGAPGTYSATGSAWIAGATCSFDVAASEEGEAVLLSATIEPPADAAPTVPVVWGLVLPAERLRAEALIEAQNKGSRAVLPLVDGRTVVVESGGTWSVTEETEHEHSYVVLETTPVTTEDGAQSASARLSVRAGGTP
jgi:hypothetical protein